MRAKDKTSREKAASVAEETARREEKMEKTLRNLQVKLENLQSEAAALSRRGDDALRELTEAKVRNIRVRVDLCLTTPIIFKLSRGTVAGPMQRYGRDATAERR